MIKAIITDIEGTTTDIKFVHNILFPYAKNKISEYIKNNADKVANILNNIRRNHLSENATLDEISNQLHEWIDNDQKITELKALQGLIWVEGYETKEYTGHLYSDVVSNLKKWKDAGIKLYVYSSGSVKAQKLLFGFSDEGDITPLFDGYFDTHVGGKKEAESYKNIMKEVNQDAQDVLFLSDIEAELDAAKELGLQTYHLNRDNLYNQSKHRIIQSFDEVEL